jgi:hypothetical protein
LKKNKEGIAGMKGTIALILIRNSKQQLNLLTAKDIKESYKFPCA